MMWSDVFRRSLRPARWLVLGLPVLLAAGCGVSLDPRVREDIVEIHQFPPPLMWVHDAEGRVVGIRVRLYLISAHTKRGVFVPGTINATLYVLSVRLDGSYERTVAQTWAFDERWTTGFRNTNRSSLGDSYLLFVRWPPELPVAGHEAQLEISYRRRDGAVIKSDGVRCTVPPPQGLRGQAPAPPQTEPERQRGAQPPLPTSGPARVPPAPGKLPSP